MNDKQMIDELRSLMRLDYDAARTYEQAMDRMDDRDVRERFARFRDDHDRHVDGLAKLIRDLGGTPPPRSRDITGTLFEGFVPLHGAFGPRGTLETMETNSRLTIRAYADVLSLDIPANVADVLLRNYNDEQRHFAYIEATLGLAPVP